MERVEQNWNGVEQMDLKALIAGRLPDGGVEQKRNRAEQGDLFQPVEQVEQKRNKAEQSGTEGGTDTLYPAGHEWDFGPLAGPRESDLAYSLETVEKSLGALPAERIERYLYCLDLYLDAGWQEEHAKRAAFRLALCMNNGVPRGGLT